MWRVYDSPSWELTQPHWALMPGSHLAPDDFNASAVSSISQICDTCKSNIISSTDKGCYVLTSVHFLSVCKA